MFSWRRFIVIGAFVAAIVAVIILNAGAVTSGGGASGSIHLSELAHASGIDFIQQSPTLDPKVNHIAAHIGALGACVSVVDVNNDGWPDLYLANDYGPAELYLNHEDKHFELARAGLEDDSKSGM